MPQNQSKYEIWRQASLSQILSDKIPLYQKLAGADVEISDSIAVLSYINDPENFKQSPIEFMLGLLNVLRISHFATSEKVNEITKMGMQMPKGENIIGKFDEEDE
jgi:hypothetical protein